MWTPEEKEKRVNELLEFLNNELEAHSDNEFEYKEETLSAPGLLSNLNASFEALKINIRYQLSRRTGGPKADFLEFKDPKGITNYISKASIEELQELEDRVEYHLDTMVFYGYDNLKKGID